MDAAAFGALTLSAQLDALKDALACEDDARELVTTCSRLRDPAPLAWLCQHLLGAGWFGDAEQAWFARFLVAQDEIVVHKVLKALTQVLTPDVSEAFETMLVRALEIVPLGAISSMCLLDRTLKHQNPERRDQHVAEVVDHCEALLREGRLEALTLDLLAQIRAEANDRLLAAAAGHSPETAAALAQKRRELASEAIRILGEAPKAVSQANAEELLSRRVYTDPGHFLIELLQNAEDAGAVTWRVTCDDDRIVVWHDGKPFDARDVVGVTSIGQTTKRKQQIGFFGVGFKSVYEVTNRPQVYSDVYRFEIADVSVPKELAARPEHYPPDGTVLVLPLRPAITSNPEAVRDLFERAVALDPCVLLTLPNIDAIELELVGAHRHVIREVPAGENRRTLHQEPDGWSRTYLLEDGQLIYDGEAREAGRADRTQLLIGVRIDEEHGRPRPLRPEAPTVYSYLPTHQETGLRFFVQAHFDVPVDRERIAQESSWNRWILDNVPGHLAAIAGRITDVDVARGFLEVLPLADELSGILEAVPSGLPAAMAEVPLLPCTDGALHVPAEVAIAEPQLASLFAGAPLPRTGGVALAFLDPTLDERSQRVARALGAVDVSVDDLIAVLDRSTDELPFVTSPAGFHALYDLLMGEVDARARESTDAVVALAEQLSALPLIPDAELTRHAAVDRECPALGSAALRGVYATLRDFVPETIDPFAAAQPNPRSRAFLEFLGVRELDVEQLVSDLEGYLSDLGSPLPGPNAAPLPGSHERLNLILALVAPASRDLIERVSRLPLFLATDGRLYPVAEHDDDRGGVVAPPEVGTLGERLLALYGDVRPIADLPASRESAASKLLGHLGAPQLDVDLLVWDLGLDPPIFSLAGERLFELHAFLELARDELPTRLRKTLAKQSIWPDTDGSPGSLRGVDAVRIPALPAVCPLFPDARFLHSDVVARLHVGAMGVDPIGAERVVNALSSKAHPPFFIEADPATIGAVHTFLLEHGDVIQTAGRKKLAKRRAFLSDRGELKSLAQLSRASSSELRRAYGDLPVRAFLEPDGQSLQLVERFGLESHLQEADAETLVADLATFESWPGTREHLSALLAFLNSAAPQLSRETVARCLSLPLFPDTAGGLGPLGDLNDAHDAAHVYPCAPSVSPILEALGLRVLDPGARTALAGLTQAGGVELAETSTLVGLLAIGELPASALETLPLEALQTLLARDLDELVSDYPPQTRPSLPPANPTLCDLPIWRTVSGEVARATGIVDPGELLEWIEDGTPERADLDRSRVDAETWSRLVALAPLIVPSPAGLFLAKLVKQRAENKRRLDRQPRFLSTLERVKGVANALLVWGLDGQTDDSLAFLKTHGIPLVDARGRLRTRDLKRLGPASHRLVAGLDLQDQVLHPDLDPLTSRKTTLDRWIQNFDDVPLDQVLGALQADADDRGAPRPLDKHPVLADAARRAELYAWLVACEVRLFTDPKCRDLIRSSRLFPSDQGNLLSPRELVVDLDLPDLGIDGTPHAEVPRDTLKVITRYLDVGRPPLDELVERHLRAAYAERVKNDDREEAGRLLCYMAKRADEPGAPDVAELLRGVDVIEDDRGRFMTPEDLVLPTPSVGALIQEVWGGTYPIPSRARFSAKDPALLAFLISLGVRRVPTASSLVDALSVPRGGVSAQLALNELVGQLWRQDPELVSSLPLDDSPWVLDQDGAARKPTELYLYSHELQDLIGHFKELYADRRLEMMLGSDLLERLPFRTADDIRIEEVVYRIEAGTASGTEIPLKVYTWIERKLASGELATERLEQLLADRLWVYCEFGGYFSPDKVLGVRATELFGDRRGYWPAGLAHCPRICQVFDIPAQVSAKVVIEFLAQLSAEVVANGEAAVLADPGVPRMLTACYAFLGDRADDDDPQIALPHLHVLARELPSGRRRLISADAPTLFRSDTPTLEALFAEVGTLHLVDKGNAEERVGVERFQRALKIRRLRSAYRVEVDPDSGADRTTERTADLRTLRDRLRSLARVLPRIRLDRPELPDDGWVFDERLVPLANAGDLRAVEALKVRTVLDDVGAVTTSAAAAYDPDQTKLLVDLRVLDTLADLDEHAVGLAQGLLPCIYDGRSEKQLLDIVEILLPKKTQQRMDAYLDQRHCPRADQKVSAHDRLTTRLGAIFDYGFDQRLVTCYPVLQDTDLSLWRDPKLTERLARWVSNDLATAESDRWSDDASAWIASQLLAEVGVHEPPPALHEAMATIIKVASVSEIPADLLTPEADTLGPEDEAPPLPLPELPVEAVVTPADVPTERQVTPVAKAAVETAQAPTPAVLAGGDLASEEPSVWNRISRWFGFGDEDPPPVARPTLAIRPDWARDGANPLAPTAGVPNQLWATADALRDIASRDAKTRLTFTPHELPRPYLYALHGIGATFDPKTQGWSPQGVPETFAEPRGSGRRVLFQGKLLEGVNQLPIPLFAKPAGEVQVLQGDPGALGGVFVETHGALRVRVRGTPLVRYEVDLLEAPVLSGGGDLDGVDLALLRPTLSRVDLPTEVRTFVERERREDRPHWERAIAAQEFVQRRYVYDERFMERPEVQRRRGRLERGVGNHHLELLHAGGDHKVLGRGICYELNTMVAELLRHLDVPSLIASCWVLNEGRVDRPDHLIALAIVGSPNGPCLLPLDAATGPQGPIRPLGPRPELPTLAVGQRCPFCHEGLSALDDLTRCPGCKTVFHAECQREFGACPSIGCQGASRPSPPRPVRVVEVLPHRPEVPAVAGPWSAEPVHNLPPEDAIQHRVTHLRQAELQRIDEESKLLLRAIRLHCQVTGDATPELVEKAMTTARPAERVALLQRALVQRIPAGTVRAALLDVLRGSFAQVRRVDPAIHRLAKMGLVKISSMPTFRVRAIDE